MQENENVFQAGTMTVIGMRLPNGVVSLMWTGTFGGDREPAGLNDFLQTIAHSATSEKPRIEIRLETLTEVNTLMYLLIMRAVNMMRSHAQEVVVHYNETIVFQKEIRKNFRYLLGHAKDAMKGAAVDFRPVS